MKPGIATTQQTSSTALPQQTQLAASGSSGGYQAPVTVIREKEAEFYKVDTPYTKAESFLYCVMPGNYPATMRAVMQKRGNWTEVRSGLLTILRFHKKML